MRNELRCVWITFAFLFLIMENVILKDVLGYEKFYKVSSNGVVFSKRKNKPLSPGDNGKGYLFVHLCDNGKSKRFYIHRLVAECFIENPDNKKQVNHKDCNKGNNSVENLEWTTIKENMNHASENGRLYCSEYQKNQTSVANRGIKSHLCKISESDARSIKEMLLSKEKTHKEIALIFNTTRANVGAINRGKSWKHITL